VKGMKEESGGKKVDRFLRDYLNVAVAYIYFYEEGPNSIAKLDGGHGQIGPLDPPLILRALSDMIML